MAERIQFFNKLRAALAGLLLTSAAVLLWPCAAVAQGQPQAAPQTSSAEENAGDAAVKQGQLRDAFQHYMNAFASLPAHTSLDADKALRERIIKVVLQLNPPPAIPQDAMRHAAYAQAAVEEAGKSADASDLNNAVNEVEKALRIAPWWAQAYFNLGEVLQKAHRPGEAAEALQLYLLADPQALLAQKNGTNSQDVQMEIYKLQYEAAQNTPEAKAKRQQEEYQNWLKSLDGACYVTLMPDENPKGPPWVDEVVIHGHDVSDAIWQRPPEGEGAWVEGTVCNLAGKSCTLSHSSDKWTLTLRVADDGMSVQEEGVSGLGKPYSYDYRRTRDCPHPF